jgi:hypothetical protein
LGKSVPIVSNEQQIDQKKNINNADQLSESRDNPAAKTSKHLSIEGEDRYKAFKLQYFNQLNSLKARKKYPTFLCVSK